MSTISYQLDEFPILTTDGRYVGFVYGDAEIHWDDQYGSPVVESITINLDSMERDGKRSELRQSDPLHDIISKELVRRFNVRDIDPYEGLGRKAFYGEIAGDAECHRRRAA